MGLRDEAEQKLIIKTFEDNRDLLQHNSDLFDIYEGDLKRFILSDLHAQLNPKSFELVKARVAPINVLIQIIDKLSKIYTKPPIRTVENGTTQDEELLKFYEDEMQLDAQLNIGNELFNLHKNVHWEPFLDPVTADPRFRSIPSDRSLVMGLDPTDPMRRTHWIKIMGTIDARQGSTRSDGERILLFVYTDTEFLAIDSSGDVRDEILQKADNPEGINPFRTIPSSYLNRSYHNIIPKIDSDVFQMTKLIPILLSDLNFAVMMQSFSIIFGIDVDEKNLVMAPNSFWTFKSDPASKQTPQIGQIKPQVDILPVFQFIGGQLAFWLKSKNIRPGSVGSLTPETMASGISKIIDEMDTFEDRQKQVSYFKAGEADFWKRITKSIHPVWAETKRINTNLRWSPNVVIKTEFQEQRPNIKRSEILKDVILEVEKGLTTKKIAIRKLNPEMSDQAIDELQNEIKSERTIEITEPTDTREDNGSEVATNTNNNTNGLNTESED